MRAREMYLLLLVDFSILPDLIKQIRKDSFIGTAVVLLNSGDELVENGIKTERIGKKIR